MKVLRSGKAYPITEADFLKLRDEFTLPKYKLLISVAWYTAERWGCILQLHTTHCYHGKERPGQPRDVIVMPANTRKDGVTREVIVSNKLKRELIRYRPTEHGHMFPAKRSDEHLKLRVALDVLKDTAERAGMGHLNLSTHSTRRGAITALAKAGKNPRLIQRFTGHKSLDSLQRYIEFSDADLRSLAASL